MNQAFIVPKEHRRFTEFANAVRKEKTIGICHGDAGVGKTNSARRYANWDALESYINAWGPRGEAHVARSGRARHGVSRKSNAKLWCISSGRT